MSLHTLLSWANLSTKALAEKDEEDLAFLNASSTCTTEVSEAAESVTDSDDFSFSLTIEDPGPVEHSCTAGPIDFGAAEHDDDDDEVVIDSIAGTMAAISNDEEAYVVTKSLKQQRGAQRSSKNWRRYLRPQRVRMQPRTLAKMPSTADHAETAAAVATARGVAAAEKAREKDEADKVKVQPFERMRENFLELHRETLRRHFCSDVDRANLSKHVAHRFLSLMHAAGMGVADLTLAYHGTNANNFASIFKKGFLIGGRGTPVVNGTACGYGVYAGSNPKVSASYSTGGKLIVCAVIDAKIETQGHAVHMDSADVYSTDQEVDPCYWTTMLRIGRPRKQPSGFKRVALSQLAMTSVKHHSGFMVVPVRSQIVPLGTIRTCDMRRGVAKQPAAPPEQDREKTEKIKQNTEEDVYWPAGGNPNSTSTLQAFSPVPKHVVRVCRRAGCRVRQQQRCKERRQKAALCGKFDNT